MARLLLAILLLFPCISAACAQDREPPLLLADTTRWPRVMVEWETQDGRVKLDGERGYRSPGDKSPLGKNIECYVALGGTRLDKGCGDPHGAILRVGLYKKDPGQLFFEGIKEGGEVVVRLDRVFMNQPVQVRPATGLMHERYMLSDLTACGLDGNARNLIATVDPQDKIKERVQLESTNLGALDGAAGHGKVEAKVEEDGSVTMTVRFPYSLLRHVKDPYQRTKPGAFFEPQHFHVEMEVVPREPGK